ncbi:MAG: HSP20-like chaperone [Monoraphidium minutum]|nr:MAG: HSP20-like chaperone [Monoraphidium minutum]
MTVKTAAPAAEGAPLWPRGAPFGLPSLLQALMPFPLPAPMDVNETREDFTITMDVPGVAPEDLTVNAWRRIVTVRGARGGAPAFERSFKLPANADEAAAAAELGGGVLTLTFPKKLIGVAAAAAERLIPVAHRGGATPAAAAAAEPAAAARDAPAAAAAVAPKAAAAKPAAPAGADLARAVRRGEVAVKREADAVTFSFRR